MPPLYEYQYLRLQTFAVRCVDGYYNYSNNYRDPKYICHQQIIEILPEQLFTVGKTYHQKICAKWDYSDSTRPRCLSETVAKRQQPSFYAIESYYDYDTRMDKPEYKNVTIPKCK